MAPPKEVEFVIVQVSYQPYLKPEDPHVWSSRLGLSSVNYGGCHIGEWFDRTMAAEKSKLPHDVKIGFSEWLISTADIELFRTDDYTFDKIAVVFGAHHVHWIYYENAQRQRRFEGFGDLPVNFCTCCMNTQYIKIIQTIQNRIYENTKN